MNTVGIIPARYNSTRFPGKPLIKIGGKTMIRRVYERCTLSLNNIIVATDDEADAIHMLDYARENYEPSGKK